VNYCEIKCEIEDVKFLAQLVIKLVFNDEFQITSLFNYLGVDSIVMLCLISLEDYCSTQLEHQVSHN
jgi:hypothetical protein